MVLQSIRERLTGILAFVVLGILVIPFAFVGVNSYFQTGSANQVALVNEQEITFNDFNQSFLNYRRQMQRIMGASFDPTEYDTLVARLEHLDRMIDEELLTQASRQLDFGVDDERLAARIRDIPAFQVDGQFNVDVYQARVTAQGLTIPQFEQQMREQYQVSQLPSGISASSFATDTELNEFIALQNQERTFSALMVNADVETAVSEFSEEEIQQWYSANESDYKTEESVVIEYLELSADNITLGEDPSDDLLSDRFESQKGRFVSPEQRLVSHVLVQVSPDADEATRETARQEAEDIAARARDGEDFAALAIESSDDAGSAPSGGDLGWVEPGIMVEAFENAMYELSMDGPISDPIQTGFGWHVIQLREIKESSGQTFEEARQTLLDEYREEEAERAFLELADRMVDVIYEDPTTLEAASLDLDLPIFQEGPFPRTGGEGIAAIPAVVQESFSDLVLLQASVSDPIDIDTNHLVMVRLLEYLPVATRPLDEVREEVIAALRDEAATRQAGERAESILAQLDSGASTIVELATTEELELIEADAVTRNYFEADRTLVENVFRLDGPEGETPASSVVETSSGYAVVELASVTDGVLEEGEVIASLQSRRQLANASASSDAWALVRQLREIADVQVFEENLGVSR